MGDISAEEATRQLVLLKGASPLNNQCFDCSLKNPQWCSVNLGLYLCLDCAGKHRQYGVTISFVRSLSLDSWNTKYINSMGQGGNHRAKDYFAKHSAMKDGKVNYHDPLVLKYKAHIKAMVDRANPESVPVLVDTPAVRTVVEKEKEYKEKE